MRVHGAPLKLIELLGLLEVIVLINFCGGT